MQEVKVIPGKVEVDNSDLQKLKENLYEIKMLINSIESERCRLDIEQLVEHKLRDMERGLLWEEISAANDILNKDN